MHVTIDPIIYQVRATGGVSRIFDEILPRMCQIDPNLFIHVRWDVLQGDLKQPLPQHTRISNERYIPLQTPMYRPYRLWKRLTTLANKLQLYLEARSKRTHIWHSTYFTLPPSHWQGNVVVSVYDMNYELLENYAKHEFEDTRRAKQQAVMNAHLVLCISETVRQDVIQYYGLHPDKVHVTPLAYNTETFGLLEKSFFDHADSFPSRFILYVGGRGPHKNFDGFLKAYSGWNASQEVKLLVVGSPLNEYEQRLVQDLKIADKLEIMSNVDDVLLCKLYNKALAFIYPSHYEGFGIPLLEAMACGCPIVASHIPTSMEVAGDIPFYFELNDVNSFLLALNNAIQAKGEQSIIDAGLKQIRQFNWERTAQLTLEAYKKLVSS
jgi:glycosyltransferase involved in cell wall biosynthesis